MLVIQTLPETSMAMPVGLLKLAPTGAKFPIGAPVEESSVTLPPPLTIQMSPSASIAIALGWLKFAPGVLLLSRVRVPPDY
jgi:hypothetical protein